MRVVFLQDVPRVGKKGEVREFADGYAQNYLIPRGLARFASASDEQVIRASARRKEAAHHTHTRELEAILRRIAGTEVVVAEQANEQGHLFAQVHEAAIAAALKNQRDIVVSPEHVVLDRPIKEAGAHVVHLIAGRVRVPITVTVAAKEGRS